MSLSIGYAQAVITPSLDRPVFLAGFGRNRLATAVNDDLFARVLLLDDGKSRLALVALDLIGLARDHCLTVEQRIREQLGDIRVIIACTHTHHGPDTIGLWGPDTTTSGVDPSYLAALQETIVEHVVSAAGTMRPVHSLKAAGTPVDGVVENFRDPHIVDDELTCVQFLAEDASVLATLLIFPCHPEVMWNDNTVITSDYGWGLRETVEGTTGAPAIFFVGALGGMLSPKVEERSFAVAAEMGRTIGQAGLTSLAGAEELAVQELHVSSLEFSIPLQNILFSMAMAAGLLPQITDDRNEAITEANLIILGNCWLATVPGELLPKLGLAMKQQLIEAGATVPGIVGLANDELGYILPADDFISPDDPFNPGAQYEESMSVSAEAGPRWQAGMDQIIEQIKRKPALQ
jgi:hypothetical protein